MKRPRPKSVGRSKIRSHMLLGLAPPMARRSSSWGSTGASGSVALLSPVVTGSSRTLMRSTSTDGLKVPRARPFDLGSRYLQTVYFSSGPRGTGL